MKEVFEATYKCEECGKVYTKRNEISNKRWPCTSSGCIKVNKPYAEVSKTVSKILATKFSIEQMNTKKMHCLTWEYAIGKWVGW